MIIGKINYLNFVILILGALLLFQLQYNLKVEADEIPTNLSLLPTYYYCIILSEKLSDGIFFTNETGASENVQYPLLSGSYDNNAIWNYNKYTGETGYWVSVNGTITVDICHGTTSNLCSTPGCSGVGNVEIDISNAKWSSSFENSRNKPSITDAKPFVVGFDNENKVAKNVHPPSTVYLRYWLSLPPNTPPLTYDTNYHIMVVVAGDTCE